MTLKLIRKNSIRLRKMKNLGSRPMPESNQPWVEIPAKKRGKKK